MRTAEGLARRAASVVDAGLDLDGARLRFDDLLHTAVDFGVAAWSTVDPATELFTSCVVTGMPQSGEAAEVVFAYEFRDDEPTTFRSIAAAGRTTAVLSVATDGALQRAARFRELLGPLGATDELRAVFVADDVRWGNVVLYRSDGRFSPDDVAAVEAVAPHVTTALRQAMLRDAAARPELSPDPPGILVVRPDRRVDALTAAAARWADAAGPDQLDAAALSAAAALRARPEWPATVSRLRCPDGRWLSLEASRTAEDPAAVAVVVGLARPAQVADVLLDAIGLTPRQREVLARLLAGRSLIQLAGDLRISEHTAHDHVKAIYRQVGVSSRSELAALLQHDHYDPRKAARVPPSPYGWFLEG